MNAPGRLAARYFRSLIVGKYASGAEAFARAQDWPEADRVGDIFAKTGIGALDITDMASVTAPVAFDLMSFVRPRELLGRMQGFRQIPNNVTLIAGLNGTTAYWPGAGAPVPVSKAVYASVNLRELAVVALTVLSDELALSSGGEDFITSELGGAVIDASDVAFVDPQSTGIAGGRPASITSTAPSFDSTGATLAAIDTDLQTLLGSMSAAGSNLSSAYFVMSQKTFIFLAALRGSGGAPAFPALSTSTPSIYGVPVLASRGVATGGSPTIGYIAAVSASDVFLSNSGAITFETSANAAIEMLDNPTNNSSTPTATSLVALFQSGAQAIKATRWVNWSAARAAAAAAVLRNVAY